MKGYSLHGALCVAFLALRIQQGCRCIRSHPPLPINPSSGGLSPKAVLCSCELPRPRVSSETRPGADGVFRRRRLSPPTFASPLPSPSVMEMGGASPRTAGSKHIPGGPDRTAGQGRDISSATEGPEDPGSEEGRVRQSQTLSHRGVNPKGRQASERVLWSASWVSLPPVSPPLVLAGGLGAWQWVEEGDEGVERRRGVRGNVLPPLHWTTCSGSWCLCRHPMMRS